MSFLCNIHSHALCIHPSSWHMMTCYSNQGLKDYDFTVIWTWLWLMPYIHPLLCYYWWRWRNAIKQAGITGWSLLMTYGPIWFISHIHTCFGGSGWRIWWRDWTTLDDQVSLIPFMPTDCPPFYNIHTFESRMSLTSIWQTTAVDTTLDWDSLHIYTLLDLSTMMSKNFITTVLLELSMIQRLPLGRLFLWLLKSTTPHPKQNQISNAILSRCPWTNWIVVNQVFQEHFGTAFSRTPRFDGSKSLSKKATDALQVLSPLEHQ